VRGNLEARGEVPHVATRKDAKGRRQPARKPERHKVPTESQKQVTLQGAARMGAAKAKSEVNEVVRLRTRVQELEAEVHQLNHEVRMRRYP
jgi:hypothetical protein